MRIRPVTLAVNVEKKMDFIAGRSKRRTGLADRRMYGARGKRQREDQRAGRP